MVYILTNALQRLHRCLKYIYIYYIYIIHTRRSAYLLSLCSPIMAAYNYENNKQDALYKLIYYSKSALHVSGDVFAHQQEHLSVFTVSGSVHPSCCRHQAAATWVNTARYCKYSQVLLLMGDNIARNM